MQQGGGRAKGGRSPTAALPFLKGAHGISGRRIWVFRRIKDLTERAGVEDATLHKFRHTYSTRLLENGCDIVTVQHLLGRSELDTTRKYLSPDESLKRAAVSRLSLTG